METFAEYDTEAAVTDTTESDAAKHMPAVVYYALKLNGEAGELAEKVGKIYRDKDGVWSEEDKMLVLKELGDCLWYISRLAKWLGFSLCRVALENVKKLMDRAKRGVIGGSGDTR